MKFKTWKDFYLFLQRYHNFSCLQCKYYPKEDMDTDEEHSRWEYARFFCPHMISIVNFSFQVSCHEWTDKEGKGLRDYGDAPVYQFSDAIVDKLDKLDYSVSIEDVERLIKEVEKGD